MYEKGRPTPRLELSPEERRTLESWARRRTIAHQFSVRAAVILAVADGGTDPEIAKRVGCHRTTVGKWRRRFLRDGLDGLTDLPRSGAPRTVDDLKVEEVIVTTLESMPKGQTRWSTRSMAQKTGINSVQLSP